MVSNITMAIFGFDIGSENCYVCEPGENGIGIRMIDSFYNVPSYLYFEDKNRKFGYPAKEIQYQNSEKVYYNLKNLIGRTYDEVMEYEKLLYPVEKGPDGELLMRLTLSGEDHLVTPTQLLSMILKKLKFSSDFTPRCILSCPSYFTDTQKRELVNAATIADLRVIQILPDLSAVALNYCLYDVREEIRSTPHYVALVDIGTTSTQCIILNYHPAKNHNQMIAFHFDKNLGGRNFDEALANYFIEQHKLKLNQNSKLKLIKECELLKIKMSEQNEALTINIKNLCEKTDFVGTMSRKKFEDICKVYFERIEDVFKETLNKFNSLKKESTFPSSAIRSAQVTGGSSKIPLVLQKVKNVFRTNPIASFNKSNEIVAIGCALKSLFHEPSPILANLSNVEDYQPYQINCSYYEENSSIEEKHSINPLFKEGSKIPNAQHFEINCHELPLIFEFSYVDQNKNVHPFAKYRVYSKDSITFLQSKLFVQMRINRNGLFKVSYALLEVIEKDGSELPKQKPKDIRNGLNFYELEIEMVSIKGYLDKKTLAEYKEFDSKFEKSDLCNIEDFKYCLKEYIKKWRKQINKEEFYRYLTLDTRLQFGKELKEIEKWFLNDDENAEPKNKKDYLKRIVSLNRYTYRVEKTIFDFTNIKRYCDQLDLLMKLAKKHQGNLKIIELALEKINNSNDEGFIAERQEWIDERLEEPHNDDFTEEFQLSYEICQEKLDDIKYFLLKQKENNDNLNI